MSTANFKVQKHVLPTSHIRHYARSTRTFQEDPLRIAIKQYTPLNNLKPQPGDVTIIAAHANGVPKELYEPMWDELLALSQRAKHFRIRSIWIADVAFQGESSVLNEDKIGNDPSWYDHPRDLFLMINHFREEMPRPFIGFGHSMGGNNIINLALMHPRLFSAIILCDPVVQRVTNVAGNWMPGIASTFRRDVWPSRRVAAEAFRGNKFYQSWDPRALDLWIEHGLRNLPTALYPTPPQFEPSQAPRDGEIPVTLTTTKHQEVFAFFRSNHPPAGGDLKTWNPPRATHFDLPVDAAAAKPFYSAAPINTFDQLPFLRPPVLYIFAEKSDLSLPKFQEDKLAVTGIGVGGNGGVKEVAVKSVVIEKTGHFVPFEKPDLVAVEMFQYVEDIIRDWSEEEERQRKEWEPVSDREKFTLSKDRLWWTEKQKKMLTKI